uniref:Uncharacterized protein n=1 Tax=Timema cristinae TaxID=61476 RepID=A0A7R9CB52_TIMCR|nr:unnamed protein product [Timema cristinae]
MAVVFSPEGDPGHPPDQPPVRPVHKWPLRPGVLVHVNGAHSLSLGRLPQTSGSLVTSTPKHRPNNNHHTTGRTRDRVGKKAKRRRAVSVGALATTDEINQHSRANRIRQMFTSDNRCDTLPGVIHSKSEVVTFKKLDGSSNRGVSRKRKKPGAGSASSSSPAFCPFSKQLLLTNSPHISSTHTTHHDATPSPQTLSSPSDGMLQPDGDKAFYENLPFHGMQSAPNKPITPSLSSKHQHHHHTLVSRPSSQLSHNGSSGYGSTRSHVGPHQSGAALTANKCQSLSRVHTRRRGHISGHFPQFYSLRLHKRHRDKSPKDSNKHPNKSVPKEERVFELHAMPIKESSPEGKSSLQGNEMNNNEEDRKGNNPDIAKEKELGLSQLSLSPPVPAPRKQSPNKAVKHTYQNVPIPITPNSQELTSFQNQHHHHHHYQHHHYNFTSSQHHLLTPPSNNHPYPVGSLKRSSVANRTHLPRPPVRLEYQQPFHVTDSVVYADLALVNGRREPHYPPYYRPPPPQQAPTEYAILKFHDVGQEIDV